MGSQLFDFIGVDERTIFTKGVKKGLENMLNIAFANRWGKKGTKTTVSLIDDLTTSEGSTTPKIQVWYPGKLSDSVKAEMEQLVIQYLKIWRGAVDPATPVMIEDEDDKGAA